MLWKWVPGVHLINDQEFDESKKDLLHRHKVMDFVEKHLKHLMGVRS